MRDRSFRYARQAHQPILSGDLDLDVIGIQKLKPLPVTAMRFRSYYAELGRVSHWQALGRGLVLFLSLALGLNEACAEGAAESMSARLEKDRCSHVKKIDWAKVYLSNNIKSYSQYIGWIDCSQQRASDQKSKATIDEAKRRQSRLIATYLSTNKRIKLFFENSEPGGTNVFDPELKDVIVGALKNNGFVTDDLGSSNEVVISLNEKRWLSGTSVDYW